MKQYFIDSLISYNSYCTEELNLNGEGYCLALLLYVKTFLNRTMCFKTEDNNIHVWLQKQKDLMTYISTGTKKVTQDVELTADFNKRNTELNEAIGTLFKTVPDVEIDSIFSALESSYKDLEVNYPIEKHNVRKNINREKIHVRYVRTKK